MAARTGRPTGGAETTVRVTSVRIRGDVLDEFLGTVSEAYHTRLGRIPKHVIATALYRIALEHQEELPRYLGEPTPAATELRDDQTEAKGHAPAKCRAEEGSERAGKAGEEPHTPNDVDESGL